MFLITGIQIDLIILRTDDEKLTFT